MTHGPSHRAGSKRVRALRLRAVLAGGLVLGVGTAVTLASWTDNEFATGSFTSSVFDTQSSVNGSAYADNNTSPGATVTVSGPFAPGVTSYFPVLIRTKPNSIAGTVTLAGATLGGTDAATLGAALVYSVVKTTGSCDSRSRSDSCRVPRMAGRIRRRRRAPSGLANDDGVGAAGSGGCSHRRARTRV